MDDFLHCAFSNESHWKGPYGPLSKRPRNYPTRMDLSSQREHAFVCNTLCNIRWFRSTSSFRVLYVANISIANIAVANTASKHCKMQIMYIAKMYIVMALLVTYGGSS